jgi:maltose/moltooligosaccharide transporter
LPNAGSLGLATVGAVLTFGLIALMLLDTSINMAMQPFKMMVGDMVNEEQKGKAYSIQSLLCNAGSVVGFVFPFFFAAIGLSNVAPEGIVPDTVIWSFYVGAAILILCVIYTTIKVKEWPPKVYAEYNGTSGKEEKANWFVLLKNAPSAFWRVGLVQFFCWAAFLYMWTYVVDAVSLTVWNTADPVSEEYQIAGNWTGVLYAIQALGSVAWAMVLPRFPNMKLAYTASLILGGLGFALIPFCPNQYLQIVPFLLIGCAWAAMLACPFTLVTNALQGYGHMGAYLGLFNGTICLPQIVAALCGGLILHAIGSVQSSMMYVSGALLVAGALCVFGIKTEKK